MGFMIAKPFGLLSLFHAAIRDELRLGLRKSTLVSRIFRLSLAFDRF